MRYREKYEEIVRFVEDHREGILKDLGVLVEIPSVAVPGSVYPAPYGEACEEVLELALKMARARGMETTDRDNYYGLASLGEVEHRIGIFTHLDVVEPGDAWEYPPFSLTEKDGWVVGRGTADDKVGAVIALYTAQALKELDLLQHTQLEIYFGCCEEKGMSDLDRYLAENEQPDFSMVPDFIFPVAVGAPGVVKFTAKQKNPFKDLAFLSGGAANERTPLSASALFRGGKRDSLYVAVQGNGRVHLAEEENGIRVTAQGQNASGFGNGDEVNAVAVLTDFLAGSGALEGADQAAMERLRAITWDRDARACGFAQEVPVLGKSRLFPVLLEEKDGDLILTLRGQFPVSMAKEELEELEKRWLAPLGFEAHQIVYADAWSVDAKDGRVKCLEKAWDTVSGTAAGIRSGGSTYAGKLKNAVNFGPKDTTKCPFVRTGCGDLHQPDEARSIENILDAVKAYIVACAALDAWYGKKEEEEEEKA